jgi:hypothetical protein
MMFTLDNGRMIIKMASAFSSFQMEINMRVCSRKIKSTDLVNIIQIPVIFSKVFSRMMSSHESLYIFSSLIKLYIILIYKFIIV